MADELMYIPIDDTWNYPFCGLQLVVEQSNKNSIIVPKVVRQTNKKKLL